MNELASRGLNTLLERAFEVNNVPQAEREGRRTLIALSRLTDPAAQISPAQRQKMLAEIVAGIDKALPAINDPNVLMRQAFVLVTQGVEPLVNTLEYWGASPRTQATLRPIVQSVVRILDRCAERAKAESERVANLIKTPDSPYIAKYDELDRLAATAEYTRNMVQYYLALSIDPASPERKKIATDAAEYLKQFDVDQNPDRGIVRNRLAKLAMMSGDFDAARRLFASVISDTQDPRPAIPQQYEARYFRAVTELMAKDVVAARTARDELVAWQGANLPPDKSARDGAEAAAAMLAYRIHNLEAELARSIDEKSRANDAAVAVLMDLLARRPGLRSVIYEQLLPRLDDKADLAGVEPLLLRALVSRGEGELSKTSDDSLDKAALERAIQAAQEVVRRRGQPGVDGQMVDASALLVPFFLEKLGRKTDAAQAFVDYARDFKQSNVKNATLALDNAQALIGSLRADAATREDAPVTRAYEAFLPLAIDAPFGRKEFAYEYARRLQLNGKAKEAVAYYRMVPADDKRAAEARFLELVALKQRIDDEPANAPDRSAMLSQIQKLADEVKRVASSKGDQSMLARTSLLASDLARREGKDPARALQLLDGFEASVQSLPNADQLVNEAMYIRVQSYMAAEKYTEATQQLVQLLGKTEGSQGDQIVYNLLEKLNADFDRAQQANDRAAMKTLARNRAQLSGFLVGWAEKNADAGIRKFTYRYRVFDAETQRRAAELEDSPEARATGLKAALERYEALEKPDNLALYKASLDAKAAADPNLFDPQVKFGIALIQYALGNYQPAAGAFSQLLTSRKLGAPTYLIEDNGQQKLVDNDQYWEAILKLIRCNQKLGTGIEESKNYLKLQYITWGPRVGGKKWKTEYEALKQELIPDFRVPAATSQPL